MIKIQAEYDNKSGEIITLPFKVAQTFNVISKMVDESSLDDEPIPLDVDVETLPLVIEYMMHHHENPSLYADIVESINFDEVDTDLTKICDWDKEFFSKLTVSQLLQVISACNFLDYPRMLLIAAKTMVKVIKDRDVSEVENIIEMAAGTEGEDRNVQEMIDEVRAEV